MRNKNIKRFLTTVQAKREIKELIPLEVITKEQIEKMREKGELTFIAYIGENHLIIKYNNINSNVLYELNKDGKYKIKYNQKSFYNQEF